jgi:geranylgeranyl diphosphate synthase type II
MLTVRLSFVEQADQWRVWIDDRLARYLEADFERRSLVWSTPSHRVRSAATAGRSNQPMGLNEPTVERTAHMAPARLAEAMRYALLGGGKRIRPLLTLLGCRAVGGEPETAMPAACAVEMIHTYSLVHDDLPAMDDDDLRRGRPTCHRAFDEATAILAGDALLTLAFETLAELEPSSVAIRCVKALAEGAGMGGMVGGQQDDLHFGEPSDKLAALESLHHRKTGALINAALLMGGIVGRADEVRLSALRDYGSAVGLAFQVADDLLDVEGTVENVGKGVGKDSTAGKSTYPGLLGVDQSRELARRLVKRAKETLSPFGRSADHLAELADYVVERNR